MSFRTYDYHCNKCNHDEEDYLVEIVENIEESVVCSKCGNTMDKQITKMNFQFGAYYFKGMSPRRVEIQYCGEDGKVLKQENLKNIPTDI